MQRGAKLESCRVQEQSSAGAAHCQAALGLSGLQHVGWAQKGGDIFREKELGNMDKTNLSWGETLSDA